MFPRTYFGFTNKVGRFSRHQREALCKIDENRLLLKSDAPYFPIEGETVSCGDYGSTPSADSGAYARGHSGKCASSVPWTTVR